EPEVLLRGLDRLLGGLDSLLGFIDADDVLLDLFRDVELERLDPRARRFRVRLRLTVARDAIAAVEQRPVEVEAQLPDLVPVRARGAVRADARDVGEEVEIGAADERVRSIRSQLR